MTTDVPFVQCINCRRWELAARTSQLNCVGFYAFTIVACGSGTRDMALRVSMTSLACSPMSS